MHPVARQSFPWAEEKKLGVQYFFTSTSDLKVKKYNYVFKMALYELLCLCFWFFAISECELVPRAWVRQASELTDRLSGLLANYHIP